MVVVLVLVSGLIGSFSGGRLLGHFKLSFVNRQGKSLLTLRSSIKFCGFNHLQENHPVSVSCSIDAFRD